MFRRIHSRILLLRPNYRSVRTKFVISFAKKRVKPISMAYSAYEATDVESGVAPLVVVHGLFASKRSWKGMCRTIHEKTKPLRKVVAVDVRNHGESPHSPYHSYPHIAEDIVQFLKDNNIEKAALLGHSMGGRAVMYAALKYPQIVERLIIADTSPFTSPRSFLQLETIFPVVKAAISHSKPTISQGPETISKSLERTVNNPTFMDFLIMNLKKTDGGRLIWSKNVDVLHTNFRNIAHFPLEDVHERQFRGPALFIAGSKSDFLRQSEFEEIKRYFPKAELQLIDSGHYMHTEHPSEFAKIIVSFLNQ